MNLIDTHTHLYSRKFEADRTEMMQRARDVGVNLALLPAIDSESHREMLALEAAYPWCRAMMGLHPCSVAADPSAELNLIEEYLDARDFVAIGEIGLDYHWDKNYIPQQKQAFSLQIEWALELDRPIVIHSRESTADCVEIVSRYEGRLRGVFHCFGGSLEEAKQITDLGFYLGIGGVLTYKKSGLDEVLKQVDLQWLLLETDAPYLSPVPFRGKRNETAYISYVAEKLAEVKVISVEAVAAATTENAKKLFQL